MIEWYEESLSNGSRPISLHDLSTDLGEKVNLADQKPELARELLGKLRAWRKSVGAQEMALNPNYNKEKAHWRYSTSAISEPKTEEKHH